MPLRDYEAFWRDYWRPVFPHLRGATWPGPVPYFAQSSGTTSGTTKYIPVSRPILAANRRAALTTLALFLAPCGAAASPTGCGRAVGSAASTSCRAWTTAVRSRGS